MGNIDPTYLLPFGSPEEVLKQSVATIKHAGKDGAFVLSGGCLILDAPPENIRAMVKATKEYPV
jgi:uroporphyrinogen-III decarboxylase